MPATGLAPVVVRFASFEVDFRSRELRKRGMRIRLEEKPFQILELLLRMPGELVTRKVLRESLWPETFVGYERSLNTAVNKLRGLLGDSAQSPRFVETLPRRGYRFIAPVERQIPSEGRRKMLAVLPFENLAADDTQEFFGDGLTEELIANLGQLDSKRLGVIARTSAVQYKRTTKSIAEIAAELNVDYVLEGSVRREGVQVRITAQLIESREQTHLWSASYDRKPGDILRVQQEVASEVSRALSLKLLPPPDCQAVHPEAHEAYLRGRFFWGKRNEESLVKAIKSFEHSLSIEPGCARSFSGIADCFGLLCWFGALSPRDAGEKAWVAATRAVELDPSRNEAHASLGLVRFWYQWDWKGAEEEFLRAIELNSSYATAHQWYAAYLGAMGRLDEAREELVRARETDPLSVVIRMNAADPLFFGRQYDRAIEHLRALLDHEPRFAPALFNLGRACVQKGMYEDAIRAFDQALEWSGNREGYCALAHALGLAGRSNEARKILRELTGRRDGRYLASPLIARIHLGLGETEKAIDWLRKGIEERSFWCVFLNADPVYDEIRAEPRFQELLRLMRFQS
ncbi:MAG: winged helix-turn-helix domain-containing tetratricopeptide repeat protein [Candidatus Acidiferrales bacterium]